MPEDGGLAAPSRLSTGSGASTSGSGGYSGSSSSCSLGCAGAGRAYNFLFVLLANHVGRVARASSPCSQRPGSRRRRRGRSRTALAHRPSQVLAPGTHLPAPLGHITAEVAAPVAHLAAEVVAPRAHVLKRGRGNGEDSRFRRPSSRQAADANENHRNSKTT